MPAYYHKYDAIPAIGKTYRTLQRQLTVAKREGKPRVADVIKERLHTHRNTFVECFNHLLGLRFPDTYVQFFDTMDADRVLARLTEKSSIEDVWNMLDFRQKEVSGERYIEFTVKPEETAADGHRDT